MRFAAARVRGRSHERCDDRFFFARRHDSWHVAALSDGAGSRKRANEGARIATRIVAKHLAHILDRAWSGCPLLSAKALVSLPESLIETILGELRRYSDDDLTHFGGTLLFSACHIPSGRWVVGHLGDGVVGAIDYSGSLHTISEPDNGEFANATRFFTDPYAHRHLRLYLLAGIEGVVMMSDGSAHSLYHPKTGRLAPAVGKLFEWHAKLGDAKMSSVLRQNIRHAIAAKTHDDCTIVLQQSPTDRKTEPTIIPIGVSA